MSRSVKSSFRFCITRTPKLTSRVLNLSSGRIPPKPLHDLVCYLIRETLVSSHVKFTPKP